MTATLVPAPSSSVPEPVPAPLAPPLRLERRHWLVALAVLFVFFAPYQTLVQTVITDDAVRKGVDVDSYDMTWVQVGYVVGLLYGAFMGMWLSARIGARYTIALGMLGFALGALLTGAAVGLVSLALGRLLDGFGKMMVTALCRTTLYKQFDRLLLVAIVFAFGWYRKWGGWTSNAFAVTVILCVTLPVVLGVWLGSDFSPDEHLKRLLRSRTFVLSMMTRGLMLTQMVGVLTIVGQYATELRDYPRITAGWLMVPTTLTMAGTTLLTTWLHRRGLRHVWLVVGVVGAAACIWWLSALDNFTAKEQVAVILAFWGAL